MPAVSSVLVVGAGTAGAATAIFLAREGIAVDMVEIQPEAMALGSGITLHGNALRVLKQLGVVDEVIAAGYPFGEFAMRAPDAHSTLLAELPEAKTGGPDLLTVLGILRPDLARILVARAGETGAKTRFETTCASLEPASTGSASRSRTARRGTTTSWWARTASVNRSAVRWESRRGPCRPGWLPGESAAAGQPVSPAPSCTSAARLAPPAAPRPARSLYTHSLSCPQTVAPA